MKSLEKAWLTHRSARLHVKAELAAARSEQLCSLRRHLELAHHKHSKKGQVKSREVVLVMSKCTLVRPDCMCRLSLLVDAARSAAT